jgi:hypothetical protein
MNSMELSSSSEANSCLVTKEIPDVSLPCSQQLVLDQMVPVQKLRFCFSKIHVNIILPYAPRPSHQSFLFRFYCQGYIGLTGTKMSLV